MTNIYCKFSKINKYGKCVFLTTPEDRPTATYKFIKKVYKIIEDSKAIVYNPIWEFKKDKREIYCLTCKCDKPEKLKAYTYYDMDIEIRKCQGKYMNILVIGDPEESSSQDYEVMKF